MLRETEREYNLEKEALIREAGNNKDAEGKKTNAEEISVKKQKVKKYMYLVNELIDFDGYSEDDAIEHVYNCYFTDKGGKEKSKGARKEK